MYNLPQTELGDFGDLAGDAIYSLLAGGGDHAPGDGDKALELFDFFGVTTTGAVTGSTGAFFLR